MPKKKGPGLGRDVEISLKIMDDLCAAIDKFTGMPLKKGLHSNNISDEKLLKIINDADEKASALANMIEDIQNTVQGIKVNKNSRFTTKMASRIVTGFLAKSV